MRIPTRRSLRPSDRALPILVRAAFLFAGVLLVCSPSGAQTSQVTRPPNFDVVAKSLTDYFASLNGYKPGDLLSQSRVVAALAHISDATGWKASDQKAIVDRALADNSFLVAQLATPNGRPFMRNVAKYAGSYSRLDRLCTVSGGQQFIKDMITRKDGYIMIEYLATTRGGHELGAMLAGAQKGVDLNKPTGRIYTADDLFVALEQAYGKEKGGAPSASGAGRGK